ncbi:MAG: methyltransferase [Gemmobacter sp.]
MRGDRLSHALDSGALVLPPLGDILVLNPRAGDGLSALPMSRLVLVQGFRPDHDVLAARGLAVFPAMPPRPYAAALVCLPRARDHAQALISQAAEAVTPGGPVIVDGQKSDGVEGALRDLAARVALSGPVVKAHGRLVTFPAGPGLEDWRAVPRSLPDGFVTRPGVFSADGPDRGSALLAAALPAQMPGRGVDLGAGWGYLARAALAREGVSLLDLVEAEADALDCARQNIPDPRAAFHWADATTFRPARPAHWVICNPPFHAGRAADPALGAAFIAAAARMLGPEGTLWLVANRHLPYGRTLSALFREVSEIGTDPGFRLTRAARPFPPTRKATP